MHVISGGNRRSLEDLSLAIGLLLFSFVILGFEVTQLRVFAYSLTPVMVLSAISITMLGFGVASTVLSLWPNLLSWPLRPMLALLSMGFALSGFLANWVFMDQSVHLVVTSDFASTYTPRAILIIVLCGIPYACGGLSIALILSHRVKQSGRMYFYNLLGSGLGCYTVVLGIKPLGAERLLLLLLALSSVVGVIWATHRHRWLQGISLVMSVGFISIFPRAESIFQFKPDPIDQHGLMENAYRKIRGVDATREFSKWGPVAKVEVHSWPGQFVQAPDPIPFKILSQDGGAISALVSVHRDPLQGQRFFSGSSYGTAFSLKPGAEALIIGIGGTLDIQAALHYHARHITAVEINSVTIEVVRDAFADFLGNPYQRPEVKFVLADGRSYVRQTDKLFDVVQLTGADTLTLQSSSSLVMAENYLYTVEAFMDYLRAIKDDGIVSVIRFGREHVLLATLAKVALNRLGIKNAKRHIVILEQAYGAIVLIKRSPWTQQELQLLDERVKGSQKNNRGLHFFAYDIFHLRIGAPLAWVYHPYKKDLKAVWWLAQDHQFWQNKSNPQVPSDDRPNFFIEAWVKYFKATEVHTFMANVISMYMRFCVILTVIALLATMVPLLVIRRRALHIKGSWATLLYFFILGFCFMFLEIGLMQKAIIAVEHPTYSVAVILASLLISSACGSWLSERLGWSGRRLVFTALLGIVLLGGIYALWLSDLYAILLSIPFVMRMIAVVLTIVPLGCCMGMLFPTGLRRLGSSRKELVPWAIAINSFASVIGSMVSLPFSVLNGFSVLFGVGVGLYILAALAYSKLPVGEV